MKVRSIGRLVHQGKTCAPGEVMEVDDATATVLIGAGVVVDASAEPEKEPKPEPEKEPKPTKGGKTGAKKA
jgi:hypothetical protein